MNEQQRGRRKEGNRGDRTAVHSALRQNLWKAVSTLACSSSSVKRKQPVGALVMMHSGLASGLPERVSVSRAGSDGGSSRAGSIHETTHRLRLLQVRGE